MGWKKISLEKLADSLGVNAAEIREKQKLMDQIRSIRKKKRMSQTVLAKKVGVTQSRIAQIESGVGTSKVTFDVLLNILIILGYDFKIIPKKAA